MADRVATEKLLSGILRLSTLLLTHFRDGVQATDFVQIVGVLQQNKELRDALMEAYNSAPSVSGELKEMSVIEYAQLLTAVMPELVALMKAAKA